ncbi:siroheme synthase CysG [Minwuia thermotolerans]|uniref:Uroporphyrinogen-III C-methyltransferase n=1 Tax=Minwuia thermotolerans TaxID=2056226 RepID=A0A2M9FZJ8_9PROT|nr:siroheme synthase CysG [Minwuia thermotolerans]PJK28892.1 uroporphyrinogen-III C-methyltransferase [Minwuia thermotolerans]
MQAFPIFLKLTGRKVLVVGGGEAAVAKTRLLLDAGAAVTVVTPKPDATLSAWAAEDVISVHRREFHSQDLEEAVFVISATDDEAADRIVSDAARIAGVTVNVVDRPALSDFTMPAIVDRAPITVAISTGGAAPALARQVRGVIETALPRNLGSLAGFVDRFRGAVKAVLPTARQRRKFWDRFLDGPVARQVLRGEEHRASQDMLALINRAAAGEIIGRVAIVGGGPGDPELLTRKAHRLLQQADVIVHDRLVSDEVLDLARRDARRVYVGKARDAHFRSQDEINRILLDEARAGHLVVRLKGGDPFVFGRGGEEADFLRRQGVEVEVVPGITAATGCAAAAGFPLTHRDKASAVTFLSGQGKAGGEPDLDWRLLASARHTLAVYMGVETARASSEALIEHGRDPATPVAVIENGTLPGQRVVYGRLDELPDLLVREAVASPALIVIGEVVGDSLAVTASERLALAL